MTDKKDPDELLRERWSKASRLTLSGAVALFLLMRGAKSGAGKILEIFGLDWSSLNPHASVPTSAAAHKRATAKAV